MPGIGKTRKVNKKEGFADWGAWKKSQNPQQPKPKQQPKPRPKQQPKPKPRKGK